MGPAILISKRGQFVPLAAMICFAGIVLLTAAANVYRVARAKLEVQNMADAAALAVATLAAKEINVVVDRNEWLNHLYEDAIAKQDDLNPSGCKDNNRLGRLSKVARGEWPCSVNDSKAASYSQLVLAINQAQAMFISAYERFMGFQSGATGQNSGPNALQEILGEITGLRDPNVTIVVFNSSQYSDSAEATAIQASRQTQSGHATSNGATDLTPSNFYSMMDPNARPQFEVVDVPLNTDDHGTVPMATVLQGYPKTPKPDFHVGWMRPQWERSALNVKTGANQNTASYGAGAIVVKRVHLLMPLVNDIYVRARGMAYVVKEGGRSVDYNRMDSHGKPMPPDHFSPTYYVKLGYPS